MEPMKKRGDLVVLKSGGPVMTVSGVNNVGGISTLWFLSGETRAATIPDDCLRTATDDDLKVQAKGRG